MEQDFEQNGTAPGQKEFTFPVNVKQMGNIDKTLKIYIEDYVYTYMYQYAKTGGSKEKLMVLAGKHTYINNCDVVIISGVIQAKNTAEENGALTFTDESWIYINEQMRKYFDGLSVLGWCHVQPEFGIFMMARDEVFHKRCFKNKFQVFCTIDPMEKQECFYAYNDEMTSLRPVKGYFIYYDKNEAMQEYMLDNSISKPKEIPESIRKEEMQEFDKTDEAGFDTKDKPETVDRIDAAERIRKVLNAKEDSKRKSKNGKYAAMTVFTGAICAAFVFMCVNMVNNMDRIQTLEKEITDVKYSYETINTQIESKAEQVFAVKAQEEEQKRKEELSLMAENEKEETKKDKNLDSAAIYTIQYGDTLWSICDNYYGSPEMIVSVMEINSITDIDKLYVGERIVLPNVENN